MCSIEHDQKLRYQMNIRPTLQIDFNVNVKALIFFSSIEKLIYTHTEESDNNCSNCSNDVAAIIERMWHRQNTYERSF